MLSYQFSKNLCCIKMKDLKFKQIKSSVWCQHFLLMFFYHLNLLLWFLLGKKS